MLFDAAGTTVGRLLSSSPWSCRNGVYTLSAMTTGRYAKLSVILDPDNDSTYRQVGNGQSTLGGGIYGRSATLDNRGQGAVRFCDDTDPSNDKGCPMAVTGVVVIGNISFSGQKRCMSRPTGPRRPWTDPTRSVW